MSIKCMLCRIVYLCLMLCRITLRRTCTYGNLFLRLQNAHKPEYKQDGGWLYMRISSRRFNNIRFQQIIFMANSCLVSLVGQPQWSAQSYWITMKTKQGKTPTCFIMFDVRSYWFAFMIFILVNYCWKDGGWYWLWTQIHKYWPIKRMSDIM